MTYRLHADPCRSPPATCSNWRSSTARLFYSYPMRRALHSASVSARSYPSPWGGRILLVAA
jgi:hypothetical protein